ncbi:DUF3265 domain-containing protein [Vibrio vulnificus]|nr:DUF3265 domain-containing protein [Vibrio vulnificus]
MAFFVWVEFSVYGGLVKCSGRVLHTLIGRYVLIGKMTGVNNESA